MKILESDCPPLGFLDLPTEVRLEVYNHLFKTAKLSCETPHFTCPSCSFSICSCNFPWHIVNTCRQLREEALPLLLAATTLEVAGSLQRAAVLPVRYQTTIAHAVVVDSATFILGPSMLDKFSSLKTLELRNITVWCKFYDETFLESEQADVAMYNMALFNLKRTNRPLFLFCLSPRSYKILLACQYVVNSLNDETIHAVVDIDEKSIVHKSRGPPMRDYHSWSGFY